ncbi:MAG: C25 family peptidase propeptide domain-containing protein, partial [Bacteroidia bacterium]
MKNITRIIALLFAGIVSLHAQQSAITVISNSNGETVLRMTGGAVTLKNVTTSRGTAVLPQIESGTPLLKTGAPELDKLTASVIIPDRGQTSIEIVSSTVEEMHNIDVAPSKGNFDRSINPANV